MTAVWYIGSADTRSISTAEWQAAGITGTPAPAVWNAANGWSLPATGFTAPQLTLLAADGSFNVNGTDGVRPGSVITGTKPSQLPATQGYVDTKLAPLNKGQIFRHNELIRQAQRTRRLGPITTDITSVVTDVTDDATLTTSYQSPVSGISSGSSRLMTQAEIDACPIDISMMPAAGPATFNSSGFGYFFLDTNFFPHGLVYRRYRFMTDSSKVQLLLYPLTTGMSYQLYVDDAPVVTPDPVSVAAIGFLRLTFPSVKVRKIEVRTDCLFGVVRISTPYKIWRPEPLARPRVVLVGDSYSQPVMTDDTGSTAFVYGQGPAQTLDDRINIEDWWINAISGTGFIQRAGGYGTPNNNYNDRLAAIIACQPDAVVVPNGVPNDLYNGYTVAQTRDAAVTFVTNLRAALPDCKFIYGDGNFPPAFSGIAANALAVRNALIPLLSQLGGAYYLDMSTDKYITGTGYIGHLTTDGNADKYISGDATHPTKSGAAYIRDRWGMQIQRALRDDGTLLNTVIR
jgi:hypothetical protein